MFDKIFGKQAPTTPKAPSILGLRVGFSFDLDSLMLRLIEDQLVVNQVAPSQLILAAGMVDMGDAWIFRFYTDDEAFLQVVTQGGKSDQHVVDVKLFHYYDTLDVANTGDWDRLLKKQIGTPTYQLAGNQYDRVWASTSDYHNPVAMTETTWDNEGNISQTDQFTMLFERPLTDGTTESLFLSAEEIEETENES